jgi:pimeloyl-ACP methyl ester carboxylesterase
VRPWNFDLAAIKQPVTFWRGQRDGHAPIPLAEQQMSAIPHATIHRIPEMGHTIFHTHWEHIIKHVADDIAHRSIRSVELST